MLGTLTWRKSRNSSEASIGRRKLNFGALDILSYFSFQILNLLPREISTGNSVHG